MKSSLNEIEYVKVRLASPSRIIQWGHRKLPNNIYVGEVNIPDTLDTNTFLPSKGGLFCEQIFGPLKNFDCHCNKFKKIYKDNLICNDCGIELTDSSVRSHRMGYIKLNYPVIHFWYLNSSPNYIALLLEIEGLEKRLKVNQISKSNKFHINKYIEVTAAEFCHFWDNRINRIQLASIAYAIVEDDNLFYELHRNLQEYRRSRELGYSGYPLDSSFKLEYENENLDDSDDSNDFDNFDDFDDYDDFDDFDDYDDFDDFDNLFEKSIPKFLIGTSLIYKELKQLNLNIEIFKTRCFILLCTKILNKEKPFFQQFQWFKKWEQYRLYKIKEQSTKRLRILENLINTGSEPSWMILSVLPIIPPTLRPLTQLEKGRFISSNLNELYQLIIIRNNRISELLKAHIPEGIIINERRLLQEAVDALIDNNKCNNSIVDRNDRPLKSLSDVIKGKQGRLRLNLLGKRVDFSGRSVIIVEPNLELTQCGLPYQMSIELFKYFILTELEKEANLHKDMFSDFWFTTNLFKLDKLKIIPIINKIFEKYPIFINRAPTLHRLGIQAFKPILVQGQAIKLHPLVCSAFNADFDGDQMAIHIPISIEAQLECYGLMSTTYNILSPANRRPVIIPSQDIVLGCSYLTLDNINELHGSNHYFSNIEDVLLAYEQNKIEIHSSIWVRYNRKNLNLDKLLKKIKLKNNSFIEYYNNLQLKKNQAGEIIVQYLKTTAGRIILNYTIQKALNIL